MTPEQAIALLDNTVAQINLPRAAHQQLAQAIATLQKATAPAPPKADKP